MILAAIITVSDKGSQGKRQDLSGPAIAEMLAGADIEIKKSLVVPDEIDQIQKAIINFADIEKVDLILTTGGTGVSPRDVTPDATLKIIDKQIPGTKCSTTRQHCYGYLNQGRTHQCDDQKDKASRDPNNGELVRTINQQYYSSD